MSKLSFRARALDASKPLPVFRCEDLPDLHEYASINRAVPQMPTGMEKEEESEHHLQRAISAQQVFGEKKDTMVIPVPEAESDIGYYDSLYAGEFRMPKQLIHIQPFSLEPEHPDYDLDGDDEACLLQVQKRLQVGALQFEDMMEKLEKGSGQQLVTLQEARLLLKEDDELIQEVFEYWSRKRRSCKKPSLIPLVKQEKRDGSSTSDPYVAFRRRTEKMQTRKNRKNDEVSYEKMLKLRRDLSRAVSILEMIKRRESNKRDLLQLTLEIVEKRNGMTDFGGDIMAEAEAQRAQMKPEKVEVVRQKRKYEKKKQKVLPGPAQHPGPALFNAKDLNQYDFPSSDDEQIFSGSSEAEEENDPDGVFAFRRRAGCQYHTPLPRLGGWPWAGASEGGRGQSRYRYSLTTLTSPRRCLRVQHLTLWVISYEQYQQHLGRALVAAAFSSGPAGGWPSCPPHATLDSCRGPGSLPTRLLSPNSWGDSPRAERALAGRRPPPAESLVASQVCIRACITPPPPRWLAPPPLASGPGLVHASISRDSWKPPPGPGICPWLLDQKPATTAAMELDPRENHDQDKPALNSRTDSTVAMEVT
ncbi:hypothetical protein AALO_G00240930 [Alosa alosa]|uniref:Enhancer of polycomb homolog n=1 Tax=Alosa alosa TaxID=278164 RepID=A0AAV6FVN3_9TELE|nr:hypothetical protein AALO_G00240930 [Alosa alosa]